MGTEHRQVRWSHGKGLPVCCCGTPNMEVVESPEAGQVCGRRRASCLHAEGAD